jgi:cytochrome c5
LLKTSPRLILPAVLLACSCARFCGEDTVIYDFDMDPPSQKPADPGGDYLATSPDQARFGFPADDTPSAPPTQNVKVEPRDEQQLDVRELTPHDPSWYSGHDKKKKSEGAGGERSLAGIRDGRELYGAACAACHGADGSGEPMREKNPRVGDLRSSELQDKWKDTELTELIERGRGDMPPMRARLTVDQITAVIGHMRSLRR